MMIFTQRMRGLIKAVAVTMALAMPVVLAVSAADARAGRGFSSGSRGSRTFTMPPSTRTAPGTASPFSRSYTQPSPSRPTVGANSGGMFGRPGFLGGLAAGFLGAGLFGMLFGHGLFGGLGGLSSLLGLILQIGLIVIVARLVMSWWQRRNAPAYAGPNAAGSGPQPDYRSAAGAGYGTGAAAAPIEITPADYDAFEKLLGDIQSAWSDEDMARLQTLVTPEMAAYFGDDLKANQARGVINKVTDVKLLQGDLSEAWREGETDYASVAMRFTLVDRMVDRTGKLVDGTLDPIEATEVWTFVRPRGANWELSAIQQVS